MTLSHTPIYTDGKIGKMGLVKKVKNLRTN